MKAIIWLDVPEWQIGSEVTVYFKDTMVTKGVCEKAPEQTIPWEVMIHPDMEAIAKRDAFLSDENGEKLQEIVDSNFAK